MGAQPRRVKDGSAAPVPAPPAAGGITAAQIQAIDASTGSCDGAPFPEECATADHAAPFINDGFAQFGIESVGEKAAILSLMMFETGNFKYNRNQ